MQYFGSDAASFLHLLSPVCDLTHPAHNTSLIGYTTKVIALTRNLQSN